VRERVEIGFRRRQLRRSVRGLEHDVGGDPALVGLGLGEQLRGLVGVEAGCLEALLEIAPEGGEAQTLRALYAHIAGRFGR
jgi:hypothetical protein